MGRIRISKKEKGKGEPAPLSCWRLLLLRVHSSPTWCMTTDQPAMTYGATQPPHQRHPPRTRNYHGSKKIHHKIKIRLRFIQGQILAWFIFCWIELVLFGGYYIGVWFEPFAGPFWFSWHAMLNLPWPATLITISISHASFSAIRSCSFKLESFVSYSWLPVIICH